MAGSESSEITSEIQNNSVLTHRQDRDLAYRFNKENSQELVFAVEMMSFVMQENGEPFNDSVYSKLPGESYPFLINEAVKKCVRFVMKKFGSTVKMKVLRCFSNKAKSYARFRNFCNTTCLNAEKILTDNDVLLYFSVLLDMMCTVAYINGFRQAPELGIVLFCRTLSKCDPDLWDNVQAAAEILSKKTIVVSEVVRVVEKGIADPSSFEIIHSGMTKKEEKKLSLRFTSENSPVLVFAGELMSFVSFVMQENYQVEELVCTSSSEESYPCVINDAMKNLVRFIMEKHRSEVETILNRNCKLKQRSSYRVFRTYANAVSLKAEQEMLNNIFEFLVFSVLLAMMCILARKNDGNLRKATELGIALICRTHSNLCLHSTPELWNDLKAQAQRAFEVIGMATSVEKGSKVHNSSTASNETESKKTFQCIYCNFHSVYENCVLQHMEVHKTLLIVDRKGSSPTARYCDDCKLLFVKDGFYQIHKEIYCKAGRVQKNRLPTLLPRPQQPQLQQPTTAAASTEPVIVRISTSPSMMPGQPAN